MDLCLLRMNKFTSSDNFFLNIYIEDSLRQDDTKFNWPLKKISDGPFFSSNVQYSLEFTGWLK